MVSAPENAFKGILTGLPKASGGEFGKYYSLPALNDPRVGKPLEIVTRIVKMRTPSCRTFE